jgi:DNA-binding response OmpR family regulator
MTRSGKRCCTETSASEPAPAVDQGRSRILIALTGWGQESDRVRELQAGFDHHIVKPAEISRLQALLAGARGRRTG